MQNKVFTEVAYGKSARYDMGITDEIKRRITAADFIAKIDDFCMVTGNLMSETHFLLSGSKRPHHEIES